MRPDPCTVLFPYTTLFRSLPRAPLEIRPVPALTEKGAARGSYNAGTPEDRKSTRLNSSHSQTSYAVFCLKKKTNEPQDLRSTQHQVRRVTPPRHRLPLRLD